MGLVTVQTGVLERHCEVRPLVVVTGACVLVVGVRAGIVAVWVSVVCGVRLGDCCGGRCGWVSVVVEGANGVCCGGRCD